jgi:sec-independent protein translocase protein TatC
LAELVSSIAVHLNELRARLKVVFLSFLIILIVLVFFPSDPSYAFHHLDQYLSLVFLEHTVIAQFLQAIVSYILPNPCPVGLPPVPGCWTLIGANGIGEGMEIYFVAALLFSTVIDMPVIAYETYKFVDPALKDNERGLVYPFMVAVSVLFAVGVLFGFFILAKLLVIALSPFYVAVGISYQVDAAAFYYVVMLIIGATGAAFTAPVFIYSLIRLRVISADLFSRNRVIIWFILWIITGLFLTPDGGPLLDMVLFVPIVSMVEVAVWLGRRSVRGKDAAKVKAEGSTQPESKPPATPAREVKCPYCSKTLSRPMLFCEYCGKSIA